MGPRRPLAALTVLAFIALIGTAGVANALGRDDRGAATEEANAEHAGSERGAQLPIDGGGAEVERHLTSSDEHKGGAPVDDIGHGGTKGGVDASGANQSGGGVTATGVDAPPTPGEAPAAAASGPAPDAAAAAPIAGPVANAVVADIAPAVAPGGVGAAPPNAPAIEPAIARAAPDAFGLAGATGLVGPPDLGGVGGLAGATGLVGLPDLGAVGSVTPRATDGPSATGTLLSTGPARSLALVAVLLVVIGLFLFVHRFADRGDRKLAAARSGSDVARFR